MRQCRAKLEAEMGERVDEHEVLEAMGRAFLRGDAAASKSAPTQISVSVCPSCNVARQTGAGVDFVISPAAFERAACDAQWLGNVDGARGRAVHDVTPATRTLVLARDRHRCRVPGCRSAQNMEVHHIEHRAHGGSHEPINLVCLCGGHHALYHEGKLIIRGTAGALEVVRLDDEPVDTFHVENQATNTSESAPLHDAGDGSCGHDEATVAELRADATLALKTLGYSKDVAVRDAVERDAPHDLESLLKAALRRCGSS